MVDGRGRGRVVGTIVTCEALKQFAAADRNQIACEVVEVRYDHLTSCVGWESACEEICEKVPVIFTIRWEKEGGKWSGDRERIDVYAKVLPMVSAIDVELSSSAVNEIAELARSAKKPLLLSYHNFSETPPLEKLLKLYEEAAKMGQIVKISTMVNSEADIDTLEALLGQRGTVPLCVIGMGPRATPTRISFAQKGSCLTYGYLDEAGAPGQLSAEDLSKALGIMA